MKASADAANAAAQEGTPWYQDLPADQHEVLKQFDTPEAAVQAIQAGQKYTTASKVEDYNFQFKDAAVDQNAPPILSYKSFCLENGIAPEQAQKLLEYQTGVYAETNAAEMQQGEQTLRADWGNDYDANLAKSLSALAAIDRHTGGGLAAELKRTGGGNRPEIVKALLWVAENIGEDSLGAGGPRGTPNNTPVSTEESYADLFAGKG